MAAPEVTIAHATPEDAELLAAQLRPVEADEVRASSGKEPLPILLESVGMSDEAWTIRFNGELALIFGVVLLDESEDAGRIGCAWMLTTSLVERYPILFWKLCLKMLPFLMARWDALINSIDARHTKAVRWAKRLGFDLDEPRPFGAHGLDFHPFIITRECLHV